MSKQSANPERKKSPQMIARLRELGIPKAIAETFPLTPHEATRRWCKKLPTPTGKKVCYFGPLDDWQAAKKRYDDEKEAIVSGRERTPKIVDGIRLIDVCNRFLHDRRTLV